MLPCYDASEQLELGHASQLSISMFSFYFIVGSSPTVGMDEELERGSQLTSVSTQLGPASQLSISKLGYAKMLVPRVSCWDGPSQQLGRTHPNSWDGPSQQLGRTHPNSWDEPIPTVGTTIPKEPSESSQLLGRSIPSKLLG